MTIIKILQNAAIKGLATLYGHNFPEIDFQVSQTKYAFEGDYTIVLFSLIKKSPGISGDQLGEYIIKNYPSVFNKYNIIKGFLNINVTDNYLYDLLQKKYNDKDFGKKELNGKTIMVEYSSP